jgi:sec-independent protein translocase protein TatA
MFGLGTRELIILAAILVLLFGAKKIPELARSIGEAVRSIKGVFSEAEKKDDTTK